MFVVVVDLVNDYGAMSDMGYGDCTEVDAICSEIRLNVCHYAETDCSVNPIVFGDVGLFIVDANHDDLWEVDQDGVSAFMNLCVGIDGFSSLKSVVDVDYDWSNYTGEFVIEL